MIECRVASDGIGVQAWGSRTRTSELHGVKLVASKGGSHRAEGLRNCPRLVFSSKPPVDPYAVVARMRGRRSPCPRFARL